MLQLAVHHFGRVTIFDEYSKMLVICGKASDSEDLGYIMEGLYIKMIHNLSKGDPQSRGGDQQSRGELMLTSAVVALFDCLTMSAVSVYFRSFLDNIFALWRLADVGPCLQ